MNDTNNTKLTPALQYHAGVKFGEKPGKIEINVTKPADTADDLTLAYSPGVAEPVLEIHKDPENAYKYTAKANLVGVISNGSAILGLGNLGALASKPVMEGKAVLFKRFADIDAIDIEVNTQDPDEFIETVVRIADTFGAINLEDIKAPECFYIEEQLIKRTNIPIFHDDQHGTAIVTMAGLLNAVEIQRKKLEDCKIVILGAGAAAIATADLLQAFGVNKDHICLLDSGGVIHSERENLNRHKQKYANKRSQRNLTDACVGADIFLGFSQGNLLQVEHLKSMNDRPIIFAAANPDPEIKPELALATRKDIIVATGRSDYPNQVNNVIAFPFIFRGALDVRAREINLAMKKAAVKAIAELAKEPITPAVLNAYTDIHDLGFGKEYIVPKPMDERLCTQVSSAVAKAAVESGVAMLKE